MNRERGACLALAALVVLGAAGQESAPSLQNTTPVTWELEGRDFPTPEGGEEAAPIRTPAEQAEEEAFRKRMETVYGGGSEVGGTPSEGAIPNGPPDMNDVLWKALGALCIVVGMILLSGFLLRRYAARTPLLMGQQLGRVIGRVSLGPRAALFYVHTGGRVLVVGVSQNGVAPVAEFGEDAFAEYLPEGAAAPDLPGSRQDFLAALGAATGKEEPTSASDDELTQLRSDLQRLQRHLRESVRDRES